MFENYSTTLFYFSSKNTIFTYTNGLFCNCSSYRMIAFFWDLGVESLSEPMWIKLIRNMSVGGMLVGSSVGVLVGVSVGASVRNANISIQVFITHMEEIRVVDIDEFTPFHSSRHLMPLKVGEDFFLHDRNFSGCYLAWLNFGWFKRSSKGRHFEFGLLLLFKYFSGTILNQ